MGDWGDIAEEKVERSQEVKDQDMCWQGVSSRNDRHDRLSVCVCVCIRKFIIWRNSYRQHGWWNSHSSQLWAKSKNLPRGSCSISQHYFLSKRKDFIFWYRKYSFFSRKWEYCLYLSCRLTQESNVNERFINLITEIFWYRYHNKHWYSWTSSVVV